jgi:hypothetical protein
VYKYLTRVFFLYSDENVTAVRTWSIKIDL